MGLNIAVYVNVTTEQTSGIRFQENGLLAFGSFCCLLLGGTYSIKGKGDTLFHLTSKVKL